MLRGDRVALVGVNGAGKTTVFNAITGIYCGGRKMVGIRYFFTGQNFGRKNLVEVRRRQPQKIQGIIQDRMAFQLA